MPFGMKLLSSEPKVTIRFDREGRILLVWEVQI